jgi:hypothetical protein
MGKRGFVTFVEFVKGGATRSTRELSGAVGRSASPAAAICPWEGWGIGIDRDSVEHTVGLVASARGEVHDADTIAIITAMPADRRWMLLLMSDFIDPRPPRLRPDATLRHRR